MSLIPWSNKRREGNGGEFGGTFPITRFRTEMDRVFDRFFTQPWNTFDDVLAPMNIWAPSLDIVDKESEFTLRAEVPGIEPGQINVSVSGNYLTISGEKGETTEDKGVDYFHCERRFGSFKRTVELPASIDPDRITAEHFNGVLTIRIPKLEAVKPRHIPVGSRSAEKTPKRVPVGAV